MTLDDYQEATRETAAYPAMGAGVYPALGLGGESGEVLEKIKKLHRDKGGAVTGEWLAGLRKELGDVLWYVSRIADDFGQSLDQIAYENLQKLADRKKRGVLGGSGDNR